MKFINKENSAIQRFQHIYLLFKFTFKVSAQEIILRHVYRDCSHLYVPSMCILDCLRAQWNISTHGNFEKSENLARAWCMVTDDLYTCIILMQDHCFRKRLMHSLPLSIRNKLSTEIRKIQHQNSTIKYYGEATPVKSPRKWNSKKARSHQSISSVKYFPNYAYRI